MTTETAPAGADDGRAPGAGPTTGVGTPPVADDERRRRRPILLVLLGCLLLLAAAVGVAYPLWWNHRSEAGGAALLHGGFGGATGGPSKVPTGTGGAVATAACRAHLPSSDAGPQRLAGILEIPSLKLKAPVLEGLSDAVLNIAVGHDTATPWPGQKGESVLLAHDVSYFSAIDKLKPGSTIVWIDACRRVVFKTVQSLVTAPGALLWPPAGGTGLSLVTCWPTNALFWTPDRYVVKAALAARGSGPIVASPVLKLPELSVPAPPSLAAEGLSLQQNSILLGGLDLAGNPSSTWAQGPSPLNVEGVALEAYFATQKAIAADDETWWRAISVKGLPMPPSWSELSKIQVTLEVEGTRVTGVTLQSAYVTMRLVVRGHDLLVASVAT